MFLWRRNIHQGIGNGMWDEIGNGTRDMAKGRKDERLDVIAKVQCGMYGNPCTMGGKPTFVERVFRSLKPSNKVKKQKMPLITLITIPNKTVTDLRDN